MIAIANVHAKPVGDATLLRFQAIADSDRPYPDMAVEFPPGQVLLIELLAFDSIAATAASVAIVAFASDLGTAWILWRLRSVRAMTAYLVLGLPLLVFSYSRLDLVAAFVAVVAVVLAEKERPAAAGVAVACGSLIRLWPALLVPTWLFARRTRAAWWGWGTLSALGLSWLAVGGRESIGQVLTFRGATGWEIASTVGVVVWIVTGGPLRIESGAFRVGEIPAWGLVGLAVVFTVLVLRIWTVRDRDNRSDGTTMCALLGGLLVCSPTLSDGYATWLLPWAALGLVDEEDRTGFAVVFAVSVLTASMLFLSFSVPGFQVATLVRAMLLVVLPIHFLRPQGSTDALTRPTA